MPGRWLGAGVLAARPRGATIALYNAGSEEHVFEVELRNIRGRPAAIGTASGHSLVVDRPAGGDGLGFNGGELLYLAVAGCVSNDLFREARRSGIEPSTVLIRVAGEFGGEPAISEEIAYEVEIEGNATAERLRALVEHVDRIAEIPNSLRAGTQVRLRAARAAPAPAPAPG
jgi:putative redox protein